MTETAECFGFRGKVAIADGDSNSARAMGQALSAMGCCISAVFTNLAAALTELPNLDVDVGLLELVWNGQPAGLELAQRVRSPAAIVFVSASSDPAVVQRAGRFRPAGFVVKPFRPAQLCASVALAIRGRELVSAAPAPLRSVPGLSELSPREREVLEHLLAFKRPPAIAGLVHISEHTVRNHLKSIFGKLQVDSQQTLLDLMTGRSEPMRSTHAAARRGANG